MRKLLTLLAMICSLSAFGQQTRQISGRIVDIADGTPLAGATVFIDPAEKQFANYTPQGAVTNLDGYFNFTLPSGVKKVVISYIGYEALTAEITSGSNFTFRLKAASNSMDAVVVTGYQKIEKRKLTSSVATVNMSDINRVGVSGVDQMLEGELAGVFSSATSGAPGSPNEIKIRSTVTINGNSSPLWVLDGIPLEGNEIPKDWSEKENIDNLYNMSIAGLNPDDIADITVLKDAGATAIYGARAANGVIVITTKSGKKDTPVRVNASASVFITSRPDTDKLKLMNASQKVDFELSLAADRRHDYRSGWGGVGRILDSSGERGAYADGGWDALSPATKEAINALRANGTDWAKKIYRPTVNQQYSINVSGGGNKVTYYVSGGYFNEQGTTRGTGLEKVNLTMKTNWDILRNLKFGASVFVGNDKRKSYLNNDYSFMNPSHYIRNVNPYLNAYDENGNYVYDPDMAAEASAETTLKYNYFEENANTRHNTKNLSVKTIFDLEYKPLSGLTLSTQFGYQIENYKVQKEADVSSYYVRKYEYDSRVEQVAYLPYGGVIQNANKETLQHIWKLQGQYSKVFNGVHELDLMAGLELRGFKVDDLNTKGFGYDRKTLRTVPIIFPDNDSGKKKALSNKFNPYMKSFQENRYLSYFMTGSYSYDNRYTFFGSLRYDGTNLFGVDRKFKYAPLWSVSGMWNVTGESFMKDVDWLNNLRLRGSYGRQGNIDRETSPYVVGEWNLSSVGGITEESIYVSNPPNKRLRWEITNMWNAAIDLGLLNNRLNMTFEVYGTRSDDLISIKSLPYETGFALSKVNFGQITTRGIEFSINTVNIDKPNFRWETSFNISHTKDKVKKIETPENSWYPSVKGHSVKSVFEIKTAGLDEHGIPMFIKDGKKVSLQEFVDFKLIGTDYGFYTDWVAGIDDSSEGVRSWFTNRGSSDPKFTGGLINRFYFKGFDLTVSCNFVINRLVKTTPFYNPANVNPGTNYMTMMNEVYSASNPNGKYPVITGYSKGDGSSWGPWEPDNYDDMRVWNWLLESPQGMMLYNNLDIWTKKLSYLRVNSIRLGYTLPSKIVSKLGLKSLRVSCEARNPFVIASNYKGYFDPETLGNYYAQPIPRTISFGINVSF